MSDSLEDELARGFNPEYHVSAGERKGVGFAEFADSVPQRVRRTYGSTPVRLKYRVRPLGIRTLPGTSIRYGFLQLDFLTLRNKDTGMPGPRACELPLGFFGASILGALFGHALDNEWASILLAARAVPSQEPSGTPAYEYNHDPSAYRAYFLRTAAHEDSPIDMSAYWLDLPRFHGRLVLWVDGV